MQYDVFISYSRKDSEVANRICKAFDEVGITYFIDRQGISGGLEFPAVLAEAIINCKIFLYLASKNSYKSKFTQSEITFAFNKKPEGSILPYIVDGSDLPLSLEFVFSAINWRRMETDPIETVLVDDLLRMLNRSSERRGRHVEETKKKSFLQRMLGIFDSNEDDAEVQFEKGDDYYWGRGVAQSYIEAVKWYRKAADQGHAGAQYSLGVCYHNGEGVAQSYAEAVKWYRKAADQGFAPAQYNLGVCYHNGEGVAQSYIEAVKWYRKAADQDHAEAQFWLGDCYEKGQGIARSYIEALAWYQKSANQGYEEAQRALARLRDNV